MSKHILTALALSLVLSAAGAAQASPNPPAVRHDYGTVLLAQSSSTPQAVSKLVFTVGSSLCQVDGRSLHMDIAPYIDPSSNRVLVSCDSLAEALGLTQQKSQQSTAIKTVTLNMEEDGGWGRDIVLAFTIGQKSVELTSKPGDKGMQAQYMFNKNLQMGTPAELNGGLVMLPVRFVAQELGYNVQWNGSDRQVIITPSTSSSS